MDNIKIEFQNEKLILRPLEKGDKEGFLEFLSNLSEQTTYNSFYEANFQHVVNDCCDFIGVYDKHRFVLENNEDQIIGIFEFSLEIPPGDRARYEKYGKYDYDLMCRFGPTIADSYQRKGLGSAIFPSMINIAKAFKKEYLILFGGVLTGNKQAINFYKKVGFIELGKFNDFHGRESMDMIIGLNSI